MGTLRAEDDRGPGGGGFAGLGGLYGGPITLASFDENAGKTNTTLVRMEGNAAFGTERQNAAIRIAAS